MNHKLTFNNKGFTLIELLVVVAIIGLLASVAIPNFRKFQAKARSAEAKIQLATAFTAETAFFSIYNTYATCLAFMGYDPSGEENSRYYAIGFQAAVNPGISEALGCNGSGSSFPAKKQIQGKSVDLDVDSPDASVVFAGARALSFRLNIIASGIVSDSVEIDSASINGHDRWGISSALPGEKQLIHLQAGY